jgi:hypothetical protein
LNIKNKKEYDDRLSISEDGKEAFIFNNFKLEVVKLQPFTEEHQ